MTENEERFFELIKEKANSLDKRAAQFEGQLQSVEKEVQEIKKALSYIKHKIGEHDEKIYHLADFQKHRGQDTDILAEIKRDLTFLTEKAAKTERDISDLKEKL